jgi:DNA (cytosine-5)-methyltransferase 1
MYLPSLRSLEICAGAGGQALGLESAGFEVEAVVEIDEMACETLRLNRPTWCVREDDVRTFDATAFEGIDLLAGGVPCPPFSVAGKQRGPDDERDLFPHALRIARQAHPRAIMLENVRGLLTNRFAGYRASFLAELRSEGYEGEWRLLLLSAFDVPQLRPRSVLVALRREEWPHFSWPTAAP